MALRILLVDDHAIVREGTRQLLERDERLVVVGETGSGREAIRLTEELRPDVLLLDVALPDLNGLEVAREVSTRVPNTRIVVLSAYNNERYVRAAIEAGAAAYLLKTTRGVDVIETLLAVAQGQFVLPAELAAELRSTLRREGRASLPETLSSRELDILRRVARGEHNREIAESLFISVRTVESHVSHILEKLGVSSRAEAVAYGAAHGWITFGEPGEETDPLQRPATEKRP